MVYNPRITGIALVTPDLGRACAFYEQALGFDPVSSARYDSAELATLRLGEETLNRFYILHCIAIPLAAALLLAIHFWRVRKDGGISGPL